MKAADIVSGLLVNVLGGLASAVICGLIGFYVGGAYVEWFMPFAELEAIFPPLIGALIGVVAGAGGWLLIRPSVARRLNPLLTFGLLLILVLLGLLLVRQVISMLVW